MKKRLLAVLLCVLMVTALLPATAFAANATSVWIAGVELTRENPCYHNGASTADNNLFGANAFFDPADATLTLDGLSVLSSTAEKTANGVAFTYAIFAEGDIDINVTADSAVSTGDAPAGYSNFAVAVNGDLTFRGTDSAKKLNTTAGAAGDATTANAKSFGVSATGIFEISGGELISTGGTATATANSESAGIYANDVNICGGKLTATAGNASGGDNASVTSIGISAYEYIIISAGEVTANGGGISGVSYPYSAGLEAREISVFGGTVSASGGVTTTGTSYTSCGIFSFGIKALTVSGGTLTAVGNDSGGESYGVNSISDSGIIKVTGGKLTAKAGVNAPRPLALSKALTLGPGVGAQGSTSSAGTSPVDYVDANNGTYRWAETTLFPALTAAANPSGSIVKDAVVTLTATPFNIDSPTYQWYSNAANSTVGASVISGATANTYAPPTGTVGTVYYFCIANGNTTSSIVGVTVVVPTVTSVAVNPASVSIQKGGTQTFNATVTGTNSPAQTVTWTVTGGVSGTSIEEDGVLTVAANETAATLTVKATSTVDTTKNGTATVTVTTPAPPAPPAPNTKQYPIIKGQNGTWTNNSKSGCGFTADADYNKFKGVSVDGNPISSDKYTSKSGSTIVTLKASYMKTLSVGKHTMRINLTDGYAETSFTVRSSDDPTMGDNSQPWLWLGIALLAVAGLAAFLVIRRRKRQNS